jgi:FkbH-like protein
MLMLRKERVIMNFKELKRNLKKDFSEFKEYRIAILGDSATQLFAQAIKAYGYNEKIKFNIFEAEYDKIESEIFNLDSDLYKFKPEYIIIWQSTEKIMDKFYLLNKEQRDSFGNEYIQEVRKLWDIINRKLNCKIINFNYVEINDNIFGNFGNKVRSSFIYNIRKLNLNLMDIAQEYKNVYINDVSYLQNFYGRENIFDTKLFFSSKMVYNIDFLPQIAKNVVDIINSINGNIKKCLILDLDNTTWGGVIGDDGINYIQIGELGIGRAFSELQMWAKQLKERGIILAVCSKNTEHIAKEPFEKHPDMILRLDDIAVFIANWETKVDNIMHIQSILNIGFDSMVFIDDNPFERNMIRKMIPDLTVPELPQDPGEYVSFLRSLNLFETASCSDTDFTRTKQYQVEAKRRELQTGFVSIDEYLEDLKMFCIVKEFDDFHIPRITQLTQRSNQFNLRTIRYTEQDINKIKLSEVYLTKYFTLEDKFGDYGLVSIVILKKINQRILFIDTLIMSCRVLKRGMEGFIFNQIVKLANEEGYEKIIGDYIPTPKNELVKDLYKDYGFQKKEGKWELNVSEYNNIKTFIEEG